MDTVPKKIRPRRYIKAVIRIAQALHGKSIKYSDNTIYIGDMPLCVNKKGTMRLIIGDNQPKISWSITDVESAWRNLSLGNIIDIQPDRVIVIHEKKSKTYTHIGMLSSIVRENGEKAIMECYGRVSCDHTHEHPFVQWSRRDLGPAINIKNRTVAFWWYGEMIPRDRYKVLNLCPVWVNGGKWPEEFPFEFTAPSGEIIVAENRNIPRDVAKLFGRVNMFQWALDNHILLRQPYREQFYQWRRDNAAYMNEEKKWYANAVDSEHVDLRGAMPHAFALWFNPTAADYDVFQWETKRAR